MLKKVCPNCRQASYSASEFGLWTGTQKERKVMLRGMTRYEDNKFLNTINWINLTRGNGKTRTTYELFRLFMKQKYDIEMPEWDIQE